MILKASKSLAGIGGLCVVAGLLGVSGCSHDTLKTATVGLAITYTPSVTGTGTGRSASPTSGWFRPIRPGGA